MTSLTDAAFQQAYSDLIEGRSFVEYKKYYQRSHRRYAETMKCIAELGLPTGAKHLDIGGGQFAVLSQRLLSFESSCGDVVSRAKDDLGEIGIKLTHVDLFKGEFEDPDTYDLITICEVIEHIPIPPYVVLGNLLKILKPGGVILLTTPNGYRFRNIVYMMLNKQILGVYRYPDGNMSLGHQQEYTMWQMRWQIAEAGFEILKCEYFDSGVSGFSIIASIAHWITTPFSLFPHLRSGIIIAARAT